MKTYGGVDVWIHIFLTSELDGAEWSASRLCRFTPGERAPDTHWIGGWVDASAGLDDMEKWKFLPPPGLKLRPLGRPARRQSLHRVRYPSSQQREKQCQYRNRPFGKRPVNYSDSCSRTHNKY
jgi:hypothetical protein